MAMLKNQRVILLFWLVKYVKSLEPHMFGPSFGPRRRRRAKPLARRLQQPTSAGKQQTAGVLPWNSLIVWKWSQVEEGTGYNIYVKSSALREAKQCIYTFRILKIFGTDSGSKWLMHLTLQRRFITLYDHKLFNKKKCHINQQGNGSPLSTSHWRTCDPMDARVSWTYMARIRLYSDRISYYMCSHDPPINIHWWSYIYGQFTESTLWWFNMAMENRHFSEVNNPQLGHLYHSCVELPKVNHHQIPSNPMKSNLIQLNHH